MRAQASLAAKREALTKMSEAFALLNAADPEGAHQFMSNVVASLGADNKLAAAYLRTATTNGCGSSRPASAGDIGIGTAPQGTVVKTHQGSPVKVPVGSGGTPHLIKSHRRRQTETMDATEKERLREKAALEAKLPGRDARPGMEHCRQLTDVLYERWVNGLSARWARA